jgi:hypothetical protein
MKRESLRTFEEREKNEKEQSRRKTRIETWERIMS